jgi:hypothetical protein
MGMMTNRKFRIVVVNGNVGSGMNESETFTPVSCSGKAFEIQCNE